jgi:hypothetical protein
MRHSLILLSILILTQNSCASALDDAFVLHKGVRSPYDGLLLDSNKSLLVYQELQECDVQKETNISLLKSLALMQDNETIYKSEISELKTQDANLNAALVKSNSNGFWNRAMWLGIGVLSTGLIVYAARR